MNVIIRLAQPKDIADLIPLMEAHARYERAEFESNGLAAKLHAAMQGNAPRLTTYLAEYKNQVVAYCSLTKEFSTWKGEDYLHMDCLFIVSDLRGRKIGQRLFAQLINHARQAGVSQIQWQTPDWNEGAVRFYESIGASYDNKRRFQYKLI